MLITYTLELGKYSLSLLLLLLLLVSVLVMLLLTIHKREQLYNKWKRERAREKWLQWKWCVDAFKILHC